MVCMLKTSALSQYCVFLKPQFLSTMLKLSVFLASLFSYTQPSRINCATTNKEFTIYIYDINA